MAVVRGTLATSLENAERTTRRVGGPSGYDVLRPREPSRNAGLQDGHHGVGTQVDGLPRGARTIDDRGDDQHRWEVRAHRLGPRPLDGQPAPSRASRRPSPKAPDQSRASVRGMDRFTGGCLCGNVRIVASGLHTGSAFVTVLTAASIMGHFFTLPRYSPGGGDDRGRDTRLRRAVFLSPLRLVRFRTRGRRNRSEPGIPGRPDQLKPTYEAGSSGASPGCRRFRSRDVRPQS